LKDLFSPFSESKAKVQGFKTFFPVFFIQLSRVMEEIVLILPESARRKTFFSVVLVELFTCD
jgi:hypothetical protein